MIVEIINTGNELLLGRVLNSHQQWLCRQLSDRGYVVTRQVAVADSAVEIQTAVRESLGRADLVITTGGLGPTSDDLTRNAIAQLLGKSLREDAPVLAQIEKFFAARNRPMPASTRSEAQVPEGATVLPNYFGTAPGLAMEVPSGKFRESNRSGWLVMLPGPPRELHPMFLEFALPLIQRAFPTPDVFVCRTFHTTDIGESTVQEMIESVMQPLVSAGMELGYCARPGQVDVRCVTCGTAAAEQIAAAEKLLRERLGESIYARDDESMEEGIIRVLTERKQTLALAESCTGGCIAHRLTNVPGASAVLLGGFVTYSNQMKQQALGVQSRTLADHGAVSEPVAREMAEGARRVTGADYAISVTGIAGPSGGSPDKPVGTVFIGLADSNGTEVWKRVNAWDRETFKEVTAQQALNFLRIALAR
ncbi:MAG TPA: competence/damage-inducible protein A [Verrucomicrobiae bacterium]|nr:competence/damage-inducible protein A [Verrucomicrobiae bacterium]